MAETAPEITNSRASQEAPQTPMRILHVSTYDSGGGAAKAAYRLHHSLLNLGEDSLMLVQQKRTTEAAIHRIPAGLPRIAMMLSQRMEVWQQAGKPVLDLAWWSNGLVIWIVWSGGFCLSVISRALSFFRVGFCPFWGKELHGS